MADADVSTASIDIDTSETTPALAEAKPDETKKLADGVR